MIPTEVPGEVLYRRVEHGRRVRYEPVGVQSICDPDMLRAGQFRLEHCPQPGLHRYRYDVTPETVAFLAAASIAEDAMVGAINRAAQCAPMGGTKHYTGKQQAILSRYRKEMADAGGLLPSHWKHTLPRDIARAGTDAVRKVWEAKR